MSKFIGISMIVVSGLIMLACLVSAVYKDHPSVRPEEDND
jgi:hypothetical protein